MARYAAFLRGVNPMNCKMGELARAFEAAGFDDVRTVLASGNVVFGASGPQRTLASRAEAAMQQHLGRSFMTLVRPLAALQALVEADPFAGHRLPAGAKRVVTFLTAAPRPAPQLPIARDGARILALDGLQAFSAYVPGPKGPVFMALIERTFGRDVTTRTWETVRKICAAG
jgi:uncharacterized protein (DUF1697 family)